MKVLTAAELLLLGLVAEMPRHGYELDHVIEQRGMRQWTQIGFSSIYYVLGKLERLALVGGEKPAGGGGGAERSRPHGRVSAPSRWSSSRCRITSRRCSSTRSASCARRRHGWRTPCP